MMNTLVRLAIIAFVVSSLPPLRALAEASSKPQVILLKLDDVVARKKNDGPVSPRWLKVTEHLKAHGIKAGFGIICESLEEENPAYFQWIKDRQAGGMVEFWCHGYHLKQAGEPGEFEQGTAEEQRAVLAKCQALAKAKLGFELPAFGPHWSGTTDATDEALQAVPEIKIWLYGPLKPKFFTRMSIPRVLALENPTFIPDVEKFKVLYEKKAAQEPVLVLQGHPDQWNDERWAGFVGILEFLKSKGVEFLTPSEWLARSTAAK